MHKRYSFSIFIAVILLFSGCNALNDSKYRKEISLWQQQRIERLKSADGWLSLAGLYWLHNGINTFGSDSSNDIIFPPEAPLFCGEIILNSDSLLFIPDIKAHIITDGQESDTIRLLTDESGKPTIMEAGRFSWLVIRRDTLLGIRLRDAENPRIRELEHIPSYPVSEKWRITAEFIPFDTLKKIEIPTAIGTTEIMESPGLLKFKLEGKDFALLPFNAENGFFIIIADLTSGIETYGAGRYMYTDLPDKQNRVILDFNKAYNPPCAFSPFATCPMPPKANILDVKIEAGEKAVHLK